MLRHKLTAADFSLYFSSRKWRLVGVSISDLHLASLPVLGWQCSSLQTLDISNCIRLTDVSALGQCSSLQTLDLSRCSDLTGVSALGQCSSLQTLDLSWCSSLADVSALSQCSSLKVLELAGCSGLIPNNKSGRRALLKLSREILRPSPPTRARYRAHRR
jgi:Leucine-rich repeat (LRR) protein